MSEKQEIAKSLVHPGMSPTEIEEFIGLACGVAPGAVRRVLQAHRLVLTEILRRGGRVVIPNVGVFDVARHKGQRGAIARKVIKKGPGVYAPVFRPSARLREILRDMGERQ